MIDRETPLAEIVGQMLLSKNTLNILYNKVSITERPAVYLCLDF